MKTDTINFLESLLFTATGNGDDIQDVMLEGKTVYDFTPAFADAVEKFIDAFRAHLEATGFDMKKLDTAERSFGGNVYFSLSGHGCGFFDDADPDIAGLHDTLKDWAGAYRFEELAYTLDVGEDGKIDLSFMALEEYRQKIFGVPGQTVAHTPGPWTTGSRMTKVQIQPPGWNMPMFIADCDCPHGPKTEAEKCANARLIAAAPELLAALCALLVVADHPNNPMATGACSSIIADARNAIAKAKGGASC